VSRNGIKDKLQKEKRFSSTLKIMLLAFALAFLGP
jgi:hypothetical protein